MLLDPREVRPEGFPDPAASGNSVSSLWRKDWRALLCTIPSPGYCTPIFFILFIHIHCIFYHELFDSLIFMWLPWCVKSKKNVPAFSSAEDPVLGWDCSSQRWDLAWFCQSIWESSFQQISYLFVNKSRGCKGVGIVRNCDSLS